MKINIETQYQERILDLWNDFKAIPVLNEPGCEYRKSPLLPKNIECNSLMFVGCNPSFRKDTIINNKEIEFYSKHEEEKDIQYFEKYNEIANYCHQVNWSHLDLLFMRETNQKVIEKLTYTNVDFISKQLDISFEIIERSNPKIIVVANALVAEFFGKKKSKHIHLYKIWKGNNLEFCEDFDNEIGTYIINISGKMTPIIFSGMLSGQRTLDIGSFERLKWQIKMILEKHK